MMVVRHDKRKRKYFGTRRWGVGNIKNARGKGGKGGAGKAGRKHKFTYITAKHPELIKSVGFVPWNRKRMKEITIKEIERRLASSGTREITLRSFKVLSNGSLSSAAKISASGFTKTAEEKIKQSGGEAIKI